MGQAAGPAPTRTKVAAAGREEVDIAPPVLDDLGSAAEVEGPMTLAAADGADPLELEASREGGTIVAACVGAWVAEDTVTT